MSGAEAIMWAVEKDPALRSDFCNVTLLDAQPDIAHLRHTVARALGEIPRLRQRVIGTPLRVVPPEFADDPTLDLDAHVRTVGLPAPGDDRALFDLCAQLAEQPFDRARPLWEFTVITGLEGGRAALLQKVHHTITDGEGALRLSLALVDFERVPASVPAAPDAAPPATDRRDTPLAVAQHTLADAAGRALGLARQSAGAVAHTIGHPGELPGQAADVARLIGSFRRQAIVTDAAHSDLLSGRSLRRRFDVHTLPLAGVRDASRNLGGSVNDGFVTVLASAFGRYHERAGSEVADLRMAMPVSTRRAGGDGSNAFAPARILVPIQPAHDVGALFKDVHQRLYAAKHEGALHVANGLAGWAAFLPTSVLVALAKSQTRTIDFTSSNMRGSPVPLYIAGSRILANFPFGPRTASACNVTMISYCDELHLGLNTDPAAISDIDAFLRDLGAAGADLLAYG